MRVTTEYQERAAELVALFDASFTASEGAEEGATVSKLAAELLATTPSDELRVFIAEREAGFAGCIIFTPLIFAEDNRRVMLLSPVAVAPECQSEGIGQTLIRAGLQALGRDGVAAVFTYGDPGYYNRTGFAQVTPEFARPPHKLSYPAGWLAQSLSEAPLAPFKGLSRCAKGLDHPSYW